MSLDKAIENGKEHRKKYRGSKAIDKSCRNHGDCEWCKDNRMYRSNKIRESSDEYLRDYYDELYDD